MSDAVTCDNIVNIGLTRKLPRVKSLFAAVVLCSRNYRRCFPVARWRRRHYFHSQKYVENRNLTSDATDGCDL